MRGGSPSRAAATALHRAEPRAAPSVQHWGGLVAGKVALGRVHKHQSVTVSVSDSTLAVELKDGDVRVIRRTTDQPVRGFKGQRPRTATSVY